MITLAMLGAFLMPPKFYDHYPTQSFRVETLPAKWEEMLCSIGNPKGEVYLACVVGKNPIIYIRDDLTPDARAKVLRHEYAHLNGWVHKPGEFIKK